MITTIDVLKFLIVFAAVWFAIGFLAFVYEQAKRGWVKFWAE